MKLIRKFSLVALSAVMVVSVISPLAFAQQAGEGGSGLQLSPTRSDVSALPGEQKQISIVLKNITQGDLTAQAVLNDFGSDNVTGTPKILVNEKERTPYSLVNMIKGLENFDLKAGESKEVKINVDVPGNASPGAYFGAVRYIALPKGQELNAQDRQVALTASVAHLVFVEVAGEINEQVTVESLIFQSGDKKDSFFLNKPDKSNLSIRNQGNGFSRPFGTVTVKKGSKEIYKYEVNNDEQKAIVLPQSSRIFTDEIKNVKTPGKYTATASVAYGNGGEVVNFKTSFWYVPAWSIVALLALIAAIVVGVYVIYKRRYAGTVRKRQK